MFGAEKAAIEVTKHDAIGTLAFKVDWMHDLTLANALKIVIHQ